MQENETEHDLKGVLELKSCRHSSMMLDIWLR